MDSTIDKISEHWRRYRRMTMTRQLAVGAVVVGIVGIVVGSALMSYSVHPGGHFWHTNPYEAQGQGLIVLSVWAACVLVAGAIGAVRNRDQMRLGFLLGGVLGIIGVVVIAVMVFGRDSAGARRVPPPPSPWPAPNPQHRR